MPPTFPALLMHASICLQFFMATITPVIGKPMATTQLVCFLDYVCLPSQVVNSMGLGILFSLFAPTGLVPSTCPVPESATKMGTWILSKIDSAQGYRHRFISDDRS